ncbi:Head-tail preconnector protein GP5 [Psychrobacter nivimaris]|uniref:Head-tail preconnector protein GP5 n=1 Tax=Psychrobacter nivimaris TaxID=281738 RepID=A0A6N7C2G6_9GAMM|nr:S49 family peptidase [Psychrobacter nivimaris]KAF0569536.1 Head-tail preconnector protein GP5 [Psychrobacter nivimaris]
MNLQAKIKRDIDSHALMSCTGLEHQLASIDFKALSRYDDDDSEAAYTVENGVATIDVRGLLVPETSSDYRSWGVTGYANLADYIQQANDDYTVTSIVLDIDSGGGYVAGLDGITETIYQSAKPIETFVSGDMYSAAYWLGASTSKVTASKQSGIGSIGVYVVHTEESGWLERYGEKVSLFRSGKWKAAFNSFMPLTDDEKQRLQEGVDESASIFFNHVAAQRNVDAKTIKGWEGDVFTAVKAKELGLIDAIADSVAVSSSTNQSNTNPKTEGESMDLQEAQAKIKELEASEAKAVQEAADAKAAALVAQNALAESQASTRQAAIDKLAADTGREFTDEQVTAFKAMDDAQFAVAEFMAKPVEVKAPELPDGLDKAQATNGREGGESKILAAVEAAKAQGAK